MVPVLIPLSLLHLQLGLIRRPLCRGYMSAVGWLFRIVARGIQIHPRVPQASMASQLAPCHLDSLLCIRN